MVRLMGGIREGSSGAPADFDRDRFNSSGIRKLKDQTVPELMRQLDSIRDTTFAFMGSLEPEDWGKKGRHGSGEVWSIEQICKVIGIHEKGHLSDMRQVIQAHE